MHFVEIEFRINGTLEELNFVQMKLCMDGISYKFCFVEIEFLTNQTLRKEFHSKGISYKLYFVEIEFRTNSTMWELNLAQMELCTFRTKSTLYERNFVLMDLFLQIGIYPKAISYDLYFVQLYFRSIGNAFKLFFVQISYN